MGFLVDVISPVVLFDPAHGDYTCNHHFTFYPFSPVFDLYGEYTTS